MQPPPINKDSISIYFEQIDRIFQETVRPRCFGCQDIFSVGETVITFTNSKDKIRHHKECYDDLMVALSMFNYYIENMQTFQERIQ